MKLLKPYIFGTLTGLLLIVLISFFPDQISLDIFACLLAFIAAIYIGFVLQSKSLKDKILEWIVASSFLILAVIGRTFSPTILAMGYLFHGFWDMIHHPKGIKTEIPVWYPAFCITIDWVIGIYIVIRFL